MASSGDVPGFGRAEVLQDDETNYKNLIMGINKQELIGKIHQIEGLSNDEKSALIELLKTHKKYGLVWEDKPEEVEERLREELPVLTEVKERAIISDDPDAPNHILIEGDNLEALTALSYTHAGKIDVIYIDPPYNTGNKDFVYNDSFVDSEDSFRHSKWLSFMSKRLRIAKQLLSDRGVLFISIDDNEQAQLKLLCDEIFGGSNFIACPVRRRRKSQANLSKNISTIHEYVIIYRKSDGCGLNKVEARLDLSSYKNPDNDPRGPYTTMPCTNRGGAKYKVVTPAGEIIEDEWRFKKETYDELFNDNRLVFPRGGKGKPRYKLFLSEKQEAGIIPNTWWDEQESNQEGAIILKQILNDNVFSNPKPVGLITFIEKLASLKDSTILDFFAGSGTTLHATMKLNAEDGGHRKCILVTNNENHICEEVTYERNKRVINGYTTPKGEEVPGLTANTLRYYKTDFIGRDRTSRNMRQLVYAATDMLCIKEDIYREVKTFGSLKLKALVSRYFEENNRRMLVIYNELAVPAFAEEISKMNVVDGKILIYVFAPGNYAYDDEFVDVLDKVELCALPAAIYNAYQKVLPKRKTKFLDGTVGDGTSPELSEDGESELNLIFGEE